MYGQRGRHRRLSDIDHTVLRAKRRVYSVALALCAVAAAVPLLMVVIQRDPFAPLYFYTNIPAILICCAGMFIIRQLRTIRVFEWVMVTAIVTYVASWGIANFFLRRIPMEGAVVGGGPVFLLAAILLCLVLPERRLRPALFAFYLTEVGLTWANLVRFPWSDAHSIQLTTHIVIAVALVCLSLIGTYQRLAFSATHEADRMRNLAHTDALTDLPNRRGMYAGLESEDDLCIALIDLDDFKQVNDTIGHEGGDQVLIAVSQLLREHADGVGSVGRWGGEEFLVVMPNTSLQRGARWAEQARRAVEEAQLTTTISLGVIARQAGQSTASLLKRADELLYEAKRAGKNQVRTG